MALYKHTMENMLRESEAFNFALFQYNPIETIAVDHEGKVKKIKRLIELQKKYDYVFYVDNEIEYLEYAWLFGLQTYHWNGNEIKYFSMKSK